VIEATDFFMALGRRIRSLRKAQGYTLEDMITYGFSARHWQQIEKGRPTTCRTLLRISLIFRMPVDKLVQSLPPARSISHDG